MPSLKVAEYLFRRLKDLGVASVHGVPGDFNLTLLDYVEPAGLRWVGNANELNAAYAADGYARIKGIGAIITTFGVGELSAVNAIAGAYTERAPVVHIVGTPARDIQEGRKLVHHTFNDGEYGRFAKIYEHLTIAQASLRDPRTAPAQIDEVLRQCLLHSRPVYIEVPMDMVHQYVSDEKLALAVSTPEPVASQTQDDVVARILERIYAAKQPIILVDGEIRPIGIVDEVQQIINATNFPTWTTNFGKGLVDDTRPNFHGIYRGTYDRTEAQDFYNGADLVLCFGPHFSSTNSYFYQIIPKPEVAILFTDTEVKFGTEIIRDIPAKLTTSRLIETIDLNRIHRYDPYPGLPRDELVPFSEVEGDKPLSQDKLWRVLANFLRPGDIILGETGTSGYGVREMAFPKHTRLFAPVTWLSIGYMLPAAQGAALAQEELMASDNYHGIKDARTVLFIGDGSFQMTAQELSTIIRLKLNVVVFVINNDGYTVERCIHGRKQGYNDISRWRYLQAPSFFGASEDTYTASVRTWKELQDVLSNDVVSNGKELRMVEIMLDREDAPIGPLSMLIDQQRRIGA